MSLIERALGITRNAAATPSKAPHRRPLPKDAGKSRSAAEPQWRVTAAMKERLGLVPPAGQEHQRLSEYRQIKRRIVDAIRDGDASKRVVLLTSALPGEGKSFTSANLAYSLAREPDFSVLLVDADVIKPQVTRCLELTDRVGLMNALVDPSLDPESLVITTDVEGLSILPAGSASEQATEYFASERMTEVRERLLAVPNRIVVIDSLPLLLTTEARVLAAIAGQVLLVVRAESTPRAAVQQAVGMLRESTTPHLVLNAIVRTRLTRYVGYGYGYGYTYDYAAPPPGGQDPK